MTAASPLLEVRELRKWYPIRAGIIPRLRGQVRAVDGVSLTLRPGEVLGIAGESGSGKSTIGRCVLRLIEPTSGEITFAGSDITRLDRHALRLFRRKAQMIFQDPYGSLDPLMTIEEIVAEPLDVQGLARGAARRQRVLELLDLVALGPEYLDRKAHELSGGQRQRVGIARALSVGPELLVADEPVSALDVSIQAQIVNLLDELKQRLNLAMLFISHDIAVMDHLSDRIAIVYLGRIMEIGPTRDLIDTPRHPYTEALLSAVPQAGLKRGPRIVLSGDVPNPADPPSGCAFRTRCRYALPACAAARPPLRAVSAEHHTACIRDDVFLSATAPQHAAAVEHDPEKWVPVFGKDHAPRKGFQVEG
jgi:oligopeptide/dipeptide ABC transporter ATP-binding protein